MYRAHGALGNKTGRAQFIVPLQIRKDGFPLSRE